MMGWYAGGMGPGAWIVMGLFWIALIALIVLSVFRLVPSKHPAGAAPPAPTTPAAHEDPIEILDRRLAQGEIDLVTYQGHRAALIDARSASLTAPGQRWQVR